MDIWEALKGAKIIMMDYDLSLFLAWFGGHGIHAYNIDGTEFSFWNVGDCGKTDADGRTVRASMRRHIEGKEKYV